MSTILLGPFETLQARPVAMPRAELETFLARLLRTGRRARYTGGDVVLIVGSDEEDENDCDDDRRRGRVLQVPHARVFLVRSYCLRASVGSKPDWAAASWKVDSVWAWSFTTFEICWFAGFSAATSLAA